jgi:hypothetical protein
VVIAAAIIGTFVHHPASSSAPSFSEVVPDDHAGMPTEADGAASEADGSASEADGVLPDGVTVFDDRYPGVANLDPELLHVLR